MSLTNHVALMAQYNHWMNQKIYIAASQVSSEILHENKKAFFGSIFATLNHLLVGDIIWLKRFRVQFLTLSSLLPLDALASPSALDELLYHNLSELRYQRDMIDGLFLGLSKELDDLQLTHVVELTNRQGIVMRKTFFSFLMHVFNHQTHHRGQISTLFSQEGIDIGVTDLAAMHLDEINLELF